jgi:hypothetical protein
MTTSNLVLNIFRSFFGKALVLALFLGVMTVATQAQTSTKLYYQQGGAFYGTVYAYNGSHFEIYTNGTVIKTFASSCRPANSGGVPGVVCSFGQFRNGQHIYSGWGYFFRNGIVYLMWTNENMGGHWRQISTPWYGFRP